MGAWASCCGSGQLSSTVGNSLKDVGLRSGANTPSHKKATLCEEIKTKYRYSDFKLSCMSACL